MAILPMAALAFMAFSIVPIAHADYGSTGIWQITISTNCNNPSLCGPFFGGFWAWAELNSDGTGGATTTGCGHSGGPVLDLNPPWGGASHCNVDLTWTTGTNGDFVIVSETDTCSNSPSHGQPTTTTFTNENLDTGIPLVPGHHHFSFNVAPGITTQITVVSY